jgi:hypothetical protein
MQLGREVRELDREDRATSRKGRKFLGNGGFYAPQPLSQHQQGIQVNII